MKRVWYDAEAAVGEIYLDGTRIMGMINLAGKTYVMTEKATYELKQKSKLRKWFERWTKGRKAHGETTH